MNKHFKTSLFKTKHALKCFFLAWGLLDYYLSFSERKKAHINLIRFQSHSKYYIALDYTIVNNPKLNMQFSRTKPLFRIFFGPGLSNEHFLIHNIQFLKETYRFIFIKKCHTCSGPNLSHSLTCVLT